MKSLALAAVFVQQLIAQSPLAISDQDSLNSMFDKTAGEKLNCTIQVLPVSLDFELRYEVRFIVGCPLQPFGGKVSVARDGVRMLFAVLLPIVWVAAAPLARAVLADLPVFFIDCQLLPPVFNPSLLLACFFAAYRLEWLILRWLKDLLAVAATPFIHTGRYRTSQLFTGSIGHRFRICCKVPTASPPMPWLNSTTKPLKLRSF